jgi:D-aminopeptidase
MRMMMAMLVCVLANATVHATERPRARDVGVVVGVMPTGPRNAIVDVPGVRVGHATVIEGDDVRTGVTAILPHGGDLYAERVPRRCSSPTATANCSA